MIRRTLFFALLLLIFPGSSPSEEMGRSTSDSLLIQGRELLRLGDSAGAVSIFSSLIEKNPDDASLQILLGNAYLKGEQYKEATSAFQRAKKLDKKIPAAYIGMGEVYVRQPAMGFNSLMNFRRAIGEAKRATKLDSTYAPAYRLLGDIYVRFIEDDKKALEYYQKYLELEPDNAEGLYFFGLACIRAGAYDRINRHILPYMERNDQDHRLIPLIAIGAFFDEQYGAALEQFERYLSKVEAEERDRYTDIKLIASNIELKAFQEITEASERQIYLDKFWGRRDPDILTPINERIIEHYRRVWYASTFLSENVTPWDRRGEVYIRFGEPDQRSTSDERQLIVSPEVEAVRMRMAVDMYGPQAAYLTFTGPVFPIRKHNLNTGERIGESFDLDADADLDDIIVGEDQAAQAVEGVAELSTSQTDPYRDPRTAIDFGTVDRASFDDFGRIKLELNFQNYAPVTMDSEFETVPWETWTYTQLQEGVEITFTDETSSGRFDFAPLPPVPTGDNPISDAARMTEYAPEVVYQKATGLAPDYYRPGIGKAPLHFFYDVADFRGSNGQTVIEVYYGVPPREVEVVEGPEDYLIQVNSALALTDWSHTDIFRTAEEFTYHNSEGFSKKKGSFVPDLLRIEAPPGTYELQVQLKDVVSGRVGLYKQALEVPDYKTGELQMSGVQLASAIEDTSDNARFRKGDIWVVPMPSRAYEAEQKIYAYFEIYNLTRNEFGQTRYKVQYLVRYSPKVSAGVTGMVTSGLRSLFKRSKPQVSVTYDQTGSDETEREYVELDLSQAKAGGNVLVVSITDLVSGKKASREVMFLYGKL